MRVFGVSDVHIDYEVNAKWIAGLSAADYRDDVLVLAGDVTDSLPRLEWCLGTLAARFKKVLFVPGNHELWVLRENHGKNSFQKFDEVCAAAASSGASMQAFHVPGLSIIPLLSWYDYSFGEPADELRRIWMDYRACRWPGGYAEKEVAAHFAALNDEEAGPAGGKVITYSHFLPRIDVMPRSIPVSGRLLYAVLGSASLDVQLRKLNADIHLYGHSHVNRRVTIDGVTYINNAFGYPSEAWMTSKSLLCIAEC
jgi:predicted phosphodiesterase